MSKSVSSGVAAPRVDLAPLSPNQVRAIVETLSRCAQPLSSFESARLLELANNPTEEGIAETERILDRRTLIRVRLDAHGIGLAASGGATPELAELGWRTFLVRVENPARLKGSLLLIGREAIPEGELDNGIHEPHIFGNDVPEVVYSNPDLDTDLSADASQWMGFRFGAGMLTDTGLQGLPVEYAALQLYTQLGGTRSALLRVGLASIPAARRYECLGIDIEFKCSAARTLQLGIKDTDGLGTTASLFIRDSAERLYPAPAHRIEPDLTYQTQIYRADGETLRLPAGQYRIVALRGPEYLRCERDFVVEADSSTALSLKLERWIHPTRLGWYPGEPHIHPEGQVYGIVSKYGLVPETLLRQVRGEGLSVGSVLIWTGGYYYEKQFLTGHVYQPNDRLPFPDTQRANNVSWQPRSTPHDAESLVRYDAEQAAFASNRLGHPILLRLKNHDYPGGRSLWDWPSWNLPILQWARSQGAIAGYAHIGNGLTANSTQLPNYEIPELTGLGANEALVDVTHGLVDFVAGGEGLPVTDLNVWYHLLNCGFIIPMIGETDFPVGSGTRKVGTVRTYVGLAEAPSGDGGYSAWVEGIKKGRLYFGDGRSHIVDLEVNGRPIGAGTLSLPKPGRVELSMKVAACLEETPTDPEADPEARGFAHWHIERSRIGTSRKVPLEVMVNGIPVERREFLADGRVREVSIAVSVSHSCWIAIRILPSVHSAPMAVSVSGQPIRASKRSAQWCLDCIEVLWRKQANRIRESERTAAAAAWDHARWVYRQILDESKVD
jgi:hypothetical protein